MKKLFLVFAVLMAFAVKSYAFSGVVNYDICDPGYYEYTVDMTNAIGCYYNMGCARPGFVDLKVYESNGNTALSERYDWVGTPNGISGGAMGQFGSAYIIIGVYDDGGGSYHGCGIYFTWGD
jgi:hypothetical protein